MDRRVKQGVVGGVLLLGGLITFLVGYSKVSDAEATCHGHTMGSDDQCVVVYSDGHTATYSPDEQLDQQRGRGHRNELVGGVLMLFGAGALVFLVDTEAAADRLRLRFGAAGRAHAAQTRAAEERLADLLGPAGPAHAAQTRAGRERVADVARQERAAEPEWTELLPRLAASRGLRQVDPSELDLRRRVEPAFDRLFRGALSLDGGVGSVVEGDLGGFPCIAVSSRVGPDGSRSAGCVLTLPSNLPRLRYERVDSAGGLHQDYTSQSDDREFAGGLLNRETLTLLRQRGLRTLGIEGSLLFGTVDGTSVRTAEELGRAWDALAEIARVLPPTWP
ncbi:hypothetical protein [Actinoallomurus sp. CA-142502]|uniref:hypothetical protein n=1 Tax=Actinoallomurus sp. CA-142502 TaxID=3239885 RepID=UPI003D8EC0EF